ncbi:YcxB family protein [Fusobacterium varium]|uniref:YcxB family protein n=3 Tax=Fusobacterium varium TaxID=856 RepID=UPI000E419A45|nr:YcxB family protein [Fusobacterium varium]MCF0171229.1 YcxB family protein [Fusobacterium varium]MDY4005196.1 YcxB family protein [Fusobacterium varium]RGJ32142.1 YcxB family protein [Fusobacterium varium]
MEILFENRYYSDKKILTEYIKDVHCRYLRIIGFFFMLVAMLYTYLILFKMKSLRLVMAALTIVIFIVSLRLIFYHLLYLKNMKKSSLNLHNGQTPESVLQFTDNSIALKEGKISMEFEYNQIKKIKEYKLIYVLMIGKRQGLILKKDSFSIGTFEEFKKFINEKIK